MDKGEQIQITFTDIDLENCNNCNCDYVAVTNPSSNELQKFCGKQRDVVVKVPTNTINLTFKSDFAGELKGFSAYWSLQEGAEKKGAENSEVKGDLRFCIWFIFWTSF